jgi:hypothetical protein
MTQKQRQRNLTAEDAEIAEKNEEKRSMEIAASRDISVPAETGIHPQNLL